LSSRAKPRDLYGRRENGECEIAWKRCKPVEPSVKKADVQERFLDFARNDDTRIRIVKHAGGQPPPLRGTSFQRREGESRPPFLWKGDARRAGGWLPRMIAGASPTVSSRAKPRDLHSRRKNGEYEIAWKRCKPVEPSGKNADVQERFLDFARNDDTRIRIVKHAGG